MENNEKKESKKVETLTIDQLKGEKPNTDNIPNNIKKEEPIKQESSKESMKEVSIEKITGGVKSVKDEDKLKNIFIEQGMSDLDKTIGRVKDESLEFRKKQFAKIREEEELSTNGSNKIEEDPSQFNFNTSENTKEELEPKKVTFIKKEEEPEREEKPKTPFASMMKDNKSSLANSLFDADLDHMKEELDDEQKKKEAKEELVNLKHSIKEKIKPINNVIDISSFTISKKPISFSNALAPSKVVHTVDWILPSSGRSFSLRQFLSEDIENLTIRNAQRNRFNAYKTVYENIWNHLVDSNKPSFESWLKQLHFYDINHLYFGIFKAAFNKINSIPYSCKKCNHTFLEDVDVDNMVKYKSKDVQIAAEKLLQTDTNTQTGEVEIELVQISDNYLVGLKQPSVYSVIFENAVLDDDFTKTYQQQLSLISFIDNIYTIDRTNNSLRPLDLKLYPNNLVKTIKEKIINFSEILRTLNSDQALNLSTYTRALGERSDDIEYKLPASKCPKCGAIIPEIVYSAEELLFTRHRLMGIMNMSID